MGVTDKAVRCKTRQEEEGENSTERMWLESISKGGSPAWRRISSPGWCCSSGWEPALLNRTPANAVTSRANGEPEKHSFQPTLSV